VIASRKCISSQQTFTLCQLVAFATDIHLWPTSGPRNRHSTCQRVAPANRRSPFDNLPAPSQPRHWAQWPFVWGPLAGDSAMLARLPFLTAGHYTKCQAC
jgi:hypothetical protein